MYRFSIYNVKVPVRCHQGIVEVHMFCTLTFELVHCVEAVTITVFPSEAKKTLVKINPVIFTFSISLSRITVQIKFFTYSSIHFISTNDPLLGPKQGIHN